MSAVKRSLDNFKEFPGKINADTGFYEFPKLFTEDKSGNKREWAMYVRLIKKASKHSFKTVNWNTAVEDQVQIKTEYLNNNVFIPTGTISEIWSEAGISDGGEITRSAPTYPPEKNIGKKNYRDHFKQALVLARGKYEKKRDEGGMPAGAIPIKTLGAKYFPMLAKRYDEYIMKNEINWPVYVQPKLDGMRCLAYLQKSSKPTFEDVILYTRRKKDYPSNEMNDTIRHELLPILLEFYGKLNPDESIYIDGELYNHNIKLQNINHFVRKGNLNEKVADGDQIQYWIYDAFYPSTAMNLKFSERVIYLDDIRDLVSNSDILHYTETLLIKNKKELDNQYVKYIKNNYEGMMIRNRNGVYSTSAKGSTGLRSKDLLKRKEVFSDEYEVVDWTQGSSGKEIGAIIWICQTKEKKHFNVTPNLDYKERYKIYKECQTNFANKYANRLLTIEYRGLTDDNKPQHAKGIDFRDE